MKDWGFWTFVATAIYAVFAALQWWAIRRQGERLGEQIRQADHAISAANRNATAAMESAKAATRSADVAHAALTVGQRAFVFFLNVTTRTDQDADGNISGIWFAPVIENTGVTPTKNLKSCVNWAVLPYPGLPSDFTFPDQQPPARGAAVLAPKSTLNLREKRFPIEVIDRVRTNLHLLFVWGWIDYDDVFPDTKRHRTEFCRIIRMGNPRVQPCLVIGSFHDAFNGIDENCMKEPTPYRGDEDD